MHHHTMGGNRPLKQEETLIMVQNTCMDTHPQCHTHSFLQSSMSIEHSKSLQTLLTHSYETKTTKLLIGLHNYLIIRISVALTIV